MTGSVRLSLKTLFGFSVEIEHEEEKLKKNGSAQQCFSSSFKKSSFFFCYWAGKTSCSFVY